MALQSPPKISSRRTFEQVFAAKLLLLEGRAPLIARMNPVMRTLANASLSLADRLTVCLDAVRPQAAASVTSSLYQCFPESKPVDEGAAVSSAFDRAIERDSAEFANYRASIGVRGEASDPSASDFASADIFPGLTAQRTAMGV